METLFAVLGFFIWLICMFYITVFIQENGFESVLIVLALPFILIWMGLKAAYEWFEFNFL